MSCSLSASDVLTWAWHLLASAKLALGVVTWEISFPVIYSSVSHGLAFFCRLSTHGKAFTPAIDYHREADITYEGVVGDGGRSEIRQVVGVGPHIISDANAQVEESCSHTFNDVPGDHYSRIVARIGRIDHVESTEPKVRLGGSDGVTDEVRSRGSKDDNCAIGRPRYL